MMVIGGCFFYYERGTPVKETCRQHWHASAAHHAANYRCSAHTGPRVRHLIRRNPAILFTIEAMDSGLFKKKINSALWLNAGEYWSTSLIRSRGLPEDDCTELGVSLLVCV